MEIIKQPAVPEIWTDEAFSDIRNSFSYWIIEMFGYKCHIFTVKVSQSQLVNFWNDITSLIATNFQADLSLEIERWNIYVVFLSADKLPKEVKYKIEQDKYCCRKLIEDNLTEFDFSDQGTRKLLGEILFSIDTTNFSRFYSGTETALQIIQKHSLHISRALEGFESHKQIGIFYEKLLKSLQ